MARSLEKLQGQYNSHASSRGPGGMGPGPGRMGPGRGRGGPRAKGKPKNLGKTVGRLLSYVGNYRWLFILVLL